MAKTKAAGIFWVVILLCSNVQAQRCVELKMPPNYLAEWNSTISKSVVPDGFSPLLCTRSYVYPNIAAFEILRLADTAFTSLTGVMNDMTPLPPPAADKNYYMQLAAIYAFEIVGKALVYREDICDSTWLKQYAQIAKQNKLDTAIEARSLQYGKDVANAILKWCSKDGYKQTKAKPKYIISDQPGQWIPTPPEYRSALEPFWQTLRPVILKDKDVYLNRNYEIAYSEKPESPFYKMVYDVYASTKEETAEQKFYVRFWDCNPDQTTFHGHNMLPRRQMSPTTHWMDLTSQLMATKTNQQEIAFCFALASIALYDAYICCWNQKYTTNLVRPVTYIRALIDSSWEPSLVTPNFPEYTSGHSTISAAIAVVLEHFFGKDYMYTDSTEIKYNIGARRFKSFTQAATEAGMSRFYGGIHYKKSVTDGLTKGRKMGEEIIARTCKWQ